MATEAIAVCAGCLCAERTLSAVSGCEHQEFFASLLNELVCAPLDVAALAVCWQCAALLSRFARFRRQARQSCITLAAYVHNNTLLKYDLLQISKPSNLQSVQLQSASYTVSHVEPTECVEIKLEVPDEGKNDRPDEKNNQIKSNGTDSDEPLNVYAENVDVALVKNEDVAVRRKYKKGKKIKTEKKNNDEDSVASKTKSGRVRVRRNVTLDPQKIRAILQTERELSLERALNARSESYVKLPHKCETCIQGFDHEETLTDHNDRRHNLTLGKYQCGTCKSVLSSQASYSTHRRRHLLRFECVACGKRTIDKGAILKHYSTEHDRTVTAFTCDVCGVESQSYRAHRYHKEKHKEKPQCEDCGRTFINKSSLRCHILNQHRTASNPQRYTCGECGKCYRGKSGLLMHAWSHSGASAYCAPCDTHFRTPHNYRHHLRSSRSHRTDTDPLYPCTECDQRFSTQRKLSEHHAWKHLNSTEHQCLQCSKTFKHRVGLERHRKYVHEKIRPPRDKMCHYCGRGFTTASILRSHIRTHTGARPLACVTCPATFAHSAALYTHNKLVHADARTQTQCVDDR